MVERGGEHSNATVMLTGIRAEQGQLAAAEIGLPATVHANVDHDVI